MQLKLLLTSSLLLILSLTIIYLAGLLAGDIAAAFSFEGEAFYTLPKSCFFFVNVLDSHTNFLNMIITLLVIFVLYK